MEAGAMYVRVLGEVAAGPDAGSLVRAPGRVPAALLAELALAQGRLVAAALLEDALWPPPTEVTRNALQAAVSRLRRTYGPAAVVGEAAGYRLAAPVTVDLVLAEAALSAAQLALDAGSREAAGTLAQEGLDLFAGRPLAGVDLPAADSVRARAQEARTGLVLAAARAQASPEAALVLLRAESAASPLDERLAAETIDALTSAGRAAEAVQEHERFRRRLARELGVDPTGPTRRAFDRALAATEAPPPSRDRRSLPAPSTPLVGRAADLALVAGAVADPGVRLLTLLGPGGMGKTRLALEAAHVLAERSSVWWVPLAPLADPALVLPTVAHVLGCAETPGEPLSRSVARQLGDGPHVLVLDNAEHLLDPVAAAVTDLLAYAPALTVLVTSREPLQVAGEQRVALAPMSDEDSVALLVARTDAVGVRVEPGPTTTAICRRLDGLPLAVELVAPRLATLDPEALLASLDGGLDTVGSRRGGEPRHRTLRATIAWSVDLLDAPTRRAFAALSVFRGGWDLAAAERVADADADTVAALLDKSLVHRLRGSTRFGMLETVREYAAELAAPDAVELGRRHTEHYLAALSGFGVHNPVRLPDAAHRWMAEERENLRSVRERAAAADGGTVARVAAMTWMDVSFSGAVAEAVEMLEAALEHAPDPLVRCSILNGLVLLLYRSDDPDRAQGFAAMELDAARECGDQVALVDALRSRSTADLTGGDPAESGLGAVRRSLELAIEVGDHWGSAAARVGLGVLAMNERKLEEALDLLRVALEDLDDGAAWYGRNVVLSNMAETLLALGQVREATEVVVGVYDEDTWIEQRVWTVDMAGKLAISSGLAYEGLVLAAAASEGFAALGQNREGLTHDEHHRLVALARESVGEDVAARALAEGRALGTDAAHARGRDVVRGLRSR
jgi:predicted ATPase/DNA-binding SARP family transcriptional activator